MLKAIQNSTVVTAPPTPNRSSLVASYFQVKRLSIAAVSREAALTEANSKAEVFSRQLKGIQQRLDASDGLERDLQRLGQEAEQMKEKADQLLEEKQVRWKGSHVGLDRFPMSPSVFFHDTIQSQQSSTEKDHNRRCVLLVLILPLRWYNWYSVVDMCEIYLNQ